MKRCAARPVLKRIRFARRLAAVVSGVVLGTGLAAAQPGVAVDAPLLPADGFASGWKGAGAPRVFSGADLYGHINGGAEAFLELGFERLTVQRYAGAEGTIGVELYRMRDATAARGIYLSRRGKESREANLKARHTATSHQLLVQQERFFVMVNRLDGGASVATVMGRAAAALVARLPADVPVPALDRLPRPHLVEGSERILRGAFGLQAIYTLGDGDILQLGGRIDAVAGRYRDPVMGDHTLVVAEYPSTSAAQRAFAHVRANLDSLIKPIRAEASRLVFEDYEKKHGVVSLEGRRLEIRVGLERRPG